MSIYHVQRIYDEGLGQYVSYETIIPTASPSPAATIPVGLGPFTASTHEVLFRYEKFTQDALGTQLVQTPMATPSVGDAPIWNGTQYAPSAVASASVETYTIVVGNALSGDTADMCDYLDPGDGSGIEAALAAAALLAIPPAVFLRDGAYGPGVTPPFVVPSSSRLFGSNSSSVQITGSPTVRQVFSLASGANIDNLAIVVPAGTPGAMSGAEVIYGDGVIRSLTIIGFGIDAAEPTETLTAFIRTPGGFVSKVADNLMVGVSRAAAGEAPIAGIDGSASTQVLGNRLITFDRGISLSGGSASVVNGNVVVGAVVDGVLLDACTNCAVSGNTLEVGPSGAWTGPSPGVSVINNSANNSITGNTVSGGAAGTEAILLDSDTSRNVVSSNAIGQRIVRDLGTDNNVDVNQLPWRLNIATASQFVSGGTAPDSTPPLQSAGRARVNGTSSAGTMIALDAFDITTDLGGPYTLVFAGGEATPQDICDRINSEWQTAAGIPSGPTAYIAFVQGGDRGRIFIESPTRDPGGSGTVSIVDNVAGTLTRMGYVSPGPIADTATAQSQPVYFGTFPRRDCAVDFSTFNGLLTALDTFTYQNETTGPAVVLLAGAPYLTLQDLVDDINGQVPLMNPAHVDPRNPTERFFLSSDLCGSVASQTLTDGVNAPLNKMGITTGAFPGLDDTPTLTPGSTPAIFSDPGTTPNSLIFEVDGCSGGIALFLASASLPATLNKRLTFQASPGLVDLTGAPTESITLGMLGMMFNHDPTRGVGQIITLGADGTALIGMSGVVGGNNPQVGQPGYVARFEAVVRSHLTSIAAGSPYEGCPAASADIRLVMTLTVPAPPPAVTPDGELRGIHFYGGPQSPFNGETADWYVDPADPPDCTRFGIYFICLGPSYGPIRWYISDAVVEVVP